MVKKRIAAIMAFGAVLLLGIFGPHILRAVIDPQQESPEEPAFPRLRVESCRIVDEAGNKVQLTGMSSHGMLWYPQYANANAMQTLKSYGANTFRIALYTNDPDGGYVQKKEETKQLAYMAIENAISMDMYIIVDWHVLRDKNPLDNQGYALEFFREIASHYGDCPNIIYEICNEPNGDTTWEEIYDYANAVIPVIREYAPNAIVLVGTPQYSYAVERVWNKPLEFENVMYSFHFYAGQFDDSYKDLLEMCDRKDIPVFVSEWGVNNGDDGNPALGQAETFVEVLNRRGISWIAWSLCNKDEVFSAIKPDCGKLSGWEPEDLTDVGNLIFRSFQ